MDCIFELLYNQLTPCQIFYLFILFFMVYMIDIPASVDIDITTKVIRANVFNILRPKRKQCKIRKNIQLEWKITLVP